MPFVFRLGDLPKLDLQVDRGTDFAAWKTQWTSYSSLSGLSEEAAEKQVEALTLCFSRETLAIVENLGLTTNERKDVTLIIAAIKRYIDGSVNESVERRNFRRRVQQPGETFDDFLVALRELVKTCNFCSEMCTQKNIRDQIIEGIVEGDTIEHLLQQENLTLATAITSCRAQEAAKKQRADITVPTSGAILAIRKPQHHKTQPNYPTPQTCPGCGARPHQGGRNQCPAYNQACRYCHKLGHYARVCHAKQPRQSPVQPSMPPTSARAIRTQLDIDDELQPSRMYTIKQVTATDPAPTISIHLSSLNGSCDTNILPDSGADISASGQKILQYLNEDVRNLLPSKVIPLTANGRKMHPIGKIRVKFELEGREHSDDVHIYPSVSGTILSWKAAKALAILPEHYPRPFPLLDKPTVAETPQG